MSTPATPRALLIDLGGVIYQGDSLIDGAADVVAWLRDRAIPHRFLTNTTSRDRQSLVDKLQRLGIEVQREHLLTPAVAAARWLDDRGLRRLALYVTDNLRREFAAFTAVDRQPEAVIIGDLGDGWDFATLNRAFRQLMGEPRPALIALGMSRYWQADDGLRLDTAPFVVALAHASGLEPTVLGKPARPFFQAGADAMHTAMTDTVMIGDDLHADVGGARDAGLIGVLVRTGKYQGRDADAEVTPDVVLDSIAGLPRWWTDQSG